MYKINSYFYNRNALKVMKESVRGVMVIVIGSGRGDTSSNPGRD